MTPLPRGLLRILAGFAVLATALAVPLAAAGADPSPCAGDGVLVVPPGGKAFEGTTGDDIILGTGGDDVVYGLGGDDTICAGDGDDLVAAGRGADTVYGEAGNDLIIGGPGDDTLLGGDGGDEISGDAGTDSVEGGEGPDVVVGGDGPDSLLGGGGGDKVFGEAGRDRLDGGEGIDELQGGPDGDRLVGGDGGDFLWGDDADDGLIGGAGDDLLQGGPGADTLEGGPGFDEMWGGECGSLAGAVRCRMVPSGRPEGNPAVDPGDVFDGGIGRDACNKNPDLPPGCDTYRGERPPYSPVKIETSREWWGLIEKAFSERALLLLGEDEQEIADALLAEVEHAKQVAACESLGDVFQETRAQGTVAYGQTTWVGLFQHDPVHWWWRSRDAGWPGASIFDPLANARIAAWMVAEDIARYWTRSDRIENRLAWARWSCDGFLDGLGYWD